MMRGIKVTCISITSEAFALKRKKKVLYIDPILLIFINKAI